MNATAHKLAAALRAAYPFIPYNGNEDQAANEKVRAAAREALAEFDALPRVESINVTGRRWFRASAGNSYCSASIIVRMSDNSEQEFKVAKTSGYGDYYMQVSGDVLEAAELLPNREHYPHGGAEPLWHYCRENGITLHYQAFDVPRERDL